MTAQNSEQLAIVTGATSGIGLAISERLLAEGWQVIGIGRDFEKCPLNEKDRFTAIKIDLSDLKKLPEELKLLIKNYPAPDALILNAGEGRFGALEQFSYQGICEMVDLNFTSGAFIARAFVPILKTRGQGDVIFMGSEAALQGKKKGSLYCATKFALRGFSQALREECASENVRVSLINPGMVRTPHFDRLNFEPGDDPANYIEVEDIAETVMMILKSRREIVFDEINVSPRVKRIQFRKKKRQKRGA